VYPFFEAMTKLFDRETLQKREREWLAPFGMKSGASRGRVHREPEHPFRTPFQRDRDRIIHCAAFRRMEYKTQVFLNHEGDHYRTRLTHTAEVAQISRSLARSLGLNEDLTEAIALAHDIGHTCFGHQGEQVLHELLADNGGFEHNAQALRIIDLLEERYATFPGLNLTFEMRESLAKKSSPEFAHLAPGDVWNDDAPLLEIQVVDLADEIAYNNHDVDDGLRSGLLSWDDLLTVPLWESISAEARKKYPGIDEKQLQVQGVRLLIDRQVSDALDTVRRNIEKREIDSVESVRCCGAGLVEFSPGMKAGVNRLKEFLRDRLYDHPHVREKTDAARDVLRALFEFYLSEDKLFPFRDPGEDADTSRRRSVADYLAGMTDRYALRKYRENIGPVPETLED
jgi:dGTPase